MAGKSGESPSETGIPTGLNRIKTRPTPSSKEHLSSKVTASKEGIRKGKKITRWFKSYLVKDSSKDLNDISANAESNESKVKVLDKEGPMRKLHKVRKLSTGKQISTDRSHSGKLPKGLKSFSHELGPKGGIRPAHPRSHSFGDLKELIGSLRSRFSAAKEVVNSELASFRKEVMEALQGNGSLSTEEMQMTEGLLVLAQECIEMSSVEFRSECEIIVQELTVKRQQIQMGLLKWHLTRMLFILTRCTRLLQFEKDSEPIDEKSLHKFKECLRRIPSCEMDWVMNPEIADPDSGSPVPPKCDAKDELDGKNQVHNLRHESWQRSEVPPMNSGTNILKNLMVAKRMTTSEDSQSEALSNVQHFREVDDNFPQDLVNKDNSNSHHEEEHSTDGSDLVICRICEELVPTTYLESHSYICAYAEKCDLNYLDLDERLLNHAEVLERIIESVNSSVNATCDNPEISRVRTNNLMSEGYSPKMSEWRSKGVEGMYEDLHEMDTASLEDSQLATFANLRGHLGMKLSQNGPPSSTGSMASTSSTNTPRSGTFDFFWIEHINHSELEDVQQMTDLVDIARCVAGTDLSEEGSHEFLLACMEDLQDVLRHSRYRALLIDTFGGRIETLLREKYMLACELVDAESSKSDSRMSTPFHKERTSIDDFEIIKPISKGAYGKVFLARKKTTGDLFAIKTKGGSQKSRFSSNDNSYRNLMEYLLKKLSLHTYIPSVYVLKKLDMLRKNDIEHIVAERNILIKVRNPFVVRFFYSFTSKENLYLVMEYLNGGDLYSLVRNVGCLEEDVARVYIAELVLALEYLHSLGIVHRDVKPDNILIAHDGHIKLTDFGLSKIGLMNSTSDLSGFETNEIMLLDANNQKAQERVDRSQQSAVGTPDYLAPEILLGSKHGYAADWWSVGIILFELITGIPPFSGEHPEIIFDNILNRKIPWPPVPKDMSYEAQDLIERFLVHDPNQRIGAEGSAEVKAHPFFSGVNWENLALQKAVFVPHPDSVDDTSYFVSRYTQSFSGVPKDQDSTDSASDTTDVISNSSGLEKMDDCADLAEFDSSPLDLSLMNFSFKNLSQLASINHDVLLQSGKDSSRCSSPYKCSSP